MKCVTMHIQHLLELVFHHRCCSCFQTSSKLLIWSIIQVYWSRLVSPLLKQLMEMNSSSDQYSLIAPADHKGLKIPLLHPTAFSGHWHFPCLLAEVPASFNYHTTRFCHFKIFSWTKRGKHHTSISSMCLSLSNRFKRGSSCTLTVSDAAVIQSFRSITFPTASDADIHSTESPT